MKNFLRKNIVLLIVPISIPFLILSLPFSFSISLLNSLVISLFLSWFLQINPLERSSKVSWHDHLFLKWFVLQLRTSMRSFSFFFSFFFFLYFSLTLCPPIWVLLSSSLILGSLKSCRHCILSPDLSLTRSKQEEKEWNVSLLLWMQKEDFG